MEYLHFDEKKIDDFSPEHIAAMYARGYVFTRKDRGVMHQTRSVRIDLSQFELSSENRRILKKVDTLGLTMTPVALPLLPDAYDWKIAKIAKDFYDEKFGPNIMSANKVREMLTDAKKSNFNTLFKYAPQGFCIAYTSQYLTHYSYPFYDLTDTQTKDIGLGMMIKAIVAAQEAHANYIYLGSLQRPSDTYKLQFRGLEWFDETTQAWQTDLEKVKGILSSTKKD